MTTDNLADNEILALAKDLKDLLDSPSVFGSKYDNNALESVFSYQVKEVNDTIFIKLDESGFTPNSDIPFIVTTGEHTHSFEAFISKEGIVILEGIEYKLMKWFVRHLESLCATLIIEGNTYEVEL